MRERHWLIIYDIRNPRRLRKVAKTLEGYALRVQKSVFEMEAPEKKVKEVREKLKKLILKEDYVVYFKVCSEDWQKRDKYGVGAHNELDNAPFQIID